MYLGDDGTIYDDRGGIYRWPTPTTRIEGDNLILEYAFPGHEKKDMTIYLEDNNLSVAGKTGRVRSLSINKKYDTDSTRAVMSNGLLTVTITVRELSKKRDIPIE